MLIYHTFQENQCLFQGGCRVIKNKIKHMLVNKYALVLLVISGNLNNHYIR